MCENQLGEMGSLLCAQPDQGLRVPIPCLCACGPIVFLCVLTYPQSLCMVTYSLLCMLTYSFFVCTGISLVSVYVDLFFAVHVDLFLVFVLTSF